MCFMKEILRKAATYVHTWTHVGDLLIYVLNVRKYTMENYVFLSVWEKISIMICLTTIGCVTHYGKKSLDYDLLNLVNLLFFQSTLMNSHNSTSNTF